MMPPMTRPQNPGIRLVAFLALLGLVLSGCRRDEVRHYRIAKETAPVVAESLTPQSAQPVTGGLAWTLPEGWTLTEGDGMRYATLKPSTPGKIDVSVIALPGIAGGELANVNRWREQMKLPPVHDEKDLAGLRNTTKSPAGNVSVFDFASAGSDKARMLVGLLSAADGNTWFLKMTGDEAAVAQARKEFLQWIASLRFE
jgi:hypothetical protein